MVALPTRLPPTVLRYDSHFLDGWGNLIEINKTAFSISWTDRGRNWKLPFWSSFSISPSVLGERARPTQRTKQTLPFLLWKERDQQNPINAGEPSKGSKQNSLLQLGFCCGWLQTTLIRDFCLRVIHNLKPNLKLPWSIFWPKATFLIVRSF